MGSFSIKWYGATWAVGLLVVDYFGRKLFKREGLPQDKATIAIIYAAIGGIIGARLAEVIFYNPHHFLLDPLEILMVWKGGLASHGGLPGVLLALYIFARRNKAIDYASLLDKAGILFLFMGSIIRIGNLFNSELPGIPTDMPWGFIFEKIDLIPRHPVQVYEAIAYLLLFVILYFHYLKHGSSKRGLYLSLFLILPLGVRICLEFFKAADSMPIPGIPLSLTQWLGVPCIIAGLISYGFYLKGAYRKKAAG